MTVMFGETKKTSCARLRVAWQRLTGVSFDDHDVRPIKRKQAEQAEEQAAVCSAHTERHSIAAVA